ncbi:hypothetical protein ACWT_5811 [Actinoplanes sp. SE50]|uniref:DUF4913 domain-containing protein n=1 Tax=unclassified Actinoplanes TaxID=2626549 RepID=UPI00023EBC0E|nr:MULTISPECIES: DUF4913 domain-containing protein [unclassified Actinoplanes]AEV86829.1 hypothetical protein ACPL_5942 [Actinoplanes sp. SE50/110]ATO85226.1 hypothetical protein ACWT_5811 [Actinoplanes sp. SE50]SLM02636.1 DUF4913 domain-containing protein [Actinoplanes sp. SE50/110]
MTTTNRAHPATLFDPVTPEEPIRLPSEPAGPARDMEPAPAASAAAAAVPAGEEGAEPLYSTVEEWVNTYLLPTFPRPVGAVGMTRWYWCRQWWRHEEAVTRLTALWYAWESARLEVTGMVGWLPLLDHNLPLLCGEDGPFRGCTVGKTADTARHELPAIAATETAPDGWWNWWDN